MPSRTICLQEHFRAEAAHWKDVYLRDGLVPTIYRERRSVVLGLVDRLALPRNSQLLDIGCGAGFTAVALAQRGYVVNVTDNVQLMMETTCELAAQSGVSKRVMAGLSDAHHLPFRGKVFELVLAIGLVSWLHSPQDALREMARVLRPGGYLILTAGNRWALYQLLDPVSFPPFRPMRRKVRAIVERFGFDGFQKRKPRPQMFSIEHVDSLLAQAGLEKVEGRTLGFGPFSWFGYEWLPDSIGLTVHRKLQALANRGLPVVRGAGREYLVLCRKRSPN